MNKLKRLLKRRTIKVALIQAVLGIAIAFSTEYELAGAVLLLKALLDIVLRADTRKEL